MFSRRASATAPRFPGGRGPTRAAWLIVGAVVLLAGCDRRDSTTGPGNAPPPPRNLDVYYYAGEVNVEWELDDAWDGEPFRIYARRQGQNEFQRIAEVTSCAEGVCRYGDRNVSASTTYVYFVAAVDPRSGQETDSAVSVEVTVPVFDPPPPPTRVEAVGLDDAVYIQWSQEALEDDDFSFYRVYMEDPDGDAFFLGETDAEGFIDELAENGRTYGFYVAAVDRHGHEGDASPLAHATPRPDYHGEILRAHQDDPDHSGFYFPETEEDPPILAGDDADRDFRVEHDGEGLALVPAAGVEVHPEGEPTSALRCGPAADFDCQDLAEAPASGYVNERVVLEPSHTYVVRYPFGGGWRYGAVRPTHVGASQEGRVLIFDWAHQLQEGNRALTPGTEDSLLEAGGARRFRKDG